MSLVQQGGGAGSAGARAPSASPAAAAVWPPAPSSASLPAGGVAGSPPTSLRVCGLPSCGLVEASPLDFRVCALCNAVAYCGEVHSALHWKAGHRRECRPPAARDGVGDGAGSTPAPSGGAAAGEHGVQPGGRRAGASPAPLLASPTTGGAAFASAPSPRPSPKPKDAATLRALVEKLSEKTGLLRWGRAAEVAKEAADLAFRLYGADSLVGASLRLDEASSLVASSTLEVGAEQCRLMQAAWDRLVGTVPLLSQRLAAGTLLPGFCREEERDYDVVLQRALCELQGKPVPDAATLRAQSVTVGYQAALKTLLAALSMASLTSELAGQQRKVHAFVHAVLDAIPKTAALQGFQPGAELSVVAFFERNMGDRGFLEPAFYASVMAKWASSAVADVLRARGSLQTGDSSMKLFLAESKERQRADVSARGFRRCGLPACGKLETTVRHCKLCCGCDAVAYCCDEHHGLHWAEGHRRECRHLRAAGARPPSTADRG